MSQFIYGSMKVRLWLHIPQSIPCRGARGWPRDLTNEREFEIVIRCLSCSRNEEELSFGSTNASVRGAGHSLSSLRAQPKVLAKADLGGTHGRNQSENVVRVCCPLVQHMSTRPIAMRQQTSGMQLAVVEKFRWHWHFLSEGSLRYWDTEGR